MKITVKTIIPTDLNKKMIHYNIKSITNIISNKIYYT